jgi:hypothetical protein
MSEYWIKFISVIISVSIADIAWTYYFIKVEQRKALAAGIWSSLIVIIGAFTVTNYISDKTFIIAGIIGTFIGTSGSIWYTNYKENKNGINK